MTSNGINALCLVEAGPLKRETLLRAQVILEKNFGVAADDAKIAMLFELIREENWSEVRFVQTFHWFLKNKKYAAWTIADWFDYGVKVYPEAWYHRQCSETCNPLPHLDRYRLADGTVVYREKDGQIVPGLEKLP